MPPAGADLLVEQPLTTDSLAALAELTRFETLTPRFSATVPPCWAEVQQEQQQRRHPQHLHQQHHGDAAQHTRTWKLQSDRWALGQRSGESGAGSNLECAHSNNILPMVESRLSL